MSTRLRYLTTDSTERATLENPYRVDEIATAARFVGRTEIFEAIGAAAATAKAATPVLLIGPAGSGKSSILKQLEADRAGLPYHFVRISCRRLSLHNVPGCLWTLAQEIGTALEQRGFAPPFLERGDFIARPHLTFQQRFLAPLLTEMERQGLMLMLDDTEPLVEDGAGQVPARQLRETLYRFSLADERLHLLFALTGQEDKMEAFDLAPFEPEQTVAIGPLSREETHKLLAGAAPFKVYDEVADYAYRLSGGHPEKVERLGHALFQRWQAGKSGQITLTDLIAVAREEPDISGHPLLVPAGSTAGPAPSRTPRRKGRQRFLYGGILVLLLLLLGATILSVRGLRDGSSAGDSLWGAVLADSTATPTPGATATEVLPVIRRVTATASPAPPATDPAEPTTSPTASATATSTPTPSITPTSTPPSRFVREIDQMPMVMIPAGRFAMGSTADDPQARPNELPEHDVALDRFYLDQYEVSVAQYAAFLNEMTDYRQTCYGYMCALPRNQAGTFSFLMEMERNPGVTAYEAVEGHADYPINYVSWYGAQAYCQYVGGRLPTEAEWEYAARGNDGRIYPWGDEPPDQTRAIYNTRFAMVQPVNALSKGASPFNVYGLAGSMWEWVSDWYDGDYYLESPVENPPGPEEGFLRVTRGGAWPENIRGDRIRAAYRNPLEPTYLASSVGFRCVRESPEGDLP